MFYPNAIESANTSPMDAPALIAVVVTEVTRPLAASVTDGT
jgi:hypothetical protein